MIRPGIWKILLVSALGASLIAFILGWIGFGVPDWQAFNRYNGSTQEYYGLWAYCQQTPPFFSTVCKRWPTAQAQLFNGSLPNFVRTAQGLITTGMILVSLAFIAGIFAAILPLLAYVAGAIMALAFIFLVIGLPIFGQQANDFSKLRGDASHKKRFGFWLFVPTIIFTFIAAVLYFIAAFLYQKFGFGNLASHSYSKRPYGGQQMLGPANVLRGLPYAARPGIYGIGGMMANPYAFSAPMAYQGPSLLSQYIAQRMPRYYAPPIQRTVITVLPQPSVVRPYVSIPNYVTPAYYTVPAAPRPTYAPVVNLTGRPLVGPVVRNA